MIGRGRSSLVRVGAAAGMLAGLLMGCERQRPTVVRGAPPGVADQPTLVTSELQAGPPAPKVDLVNPYAGDRGALAEGERLYGWFNCAGCHGPKGGGAIGPPFADADWIYGDEPENLYASIVRGRPNGMPAFGGLITEDQIWKLAAYVRSFAP